MKSFYIKKLKKKLSIEEFNYNATGFIYKTKNPIIKEIHIMDPDIISGLIIHNFNIKLKKIFALILLSEDDESGETLEIALNELARLKNLMKSKYNKLLKKKEAEKLHKKLMLTEKKIQNKIIDLELEKQELVQVEGNHKSR